MLALLATFCAVVDARSMSEAAARLHLTQPAVSRQIQALERELGVRLLLRGPRGVEPTPAGRAVYAHAARALREAEACRRLAEEWRQPGRGSLTVGAGLTLVLFTLPPVIARYRASWPEVRLRVVTGTSEETAERLLRHEVDVALVTSPARHRGLRATPLFRDPLVVVTAPGHRLAASQAVPVAELAVERLIVPGAGSGLRRHIEQVLLGRGIHPAVAMEFDSLEAVKTMVALELGVAVLPLSAVREDAAAGRVVAIPLADWPPPGGRTVSLLERRDGGATGAARAFAALAREMLAQDSPAAGA